MKPYITEDYIKFEQGGDKITIYREHVRLYKEYKNGIQIFVIDLPEPYFAECSYQSIESYWDSE